MKIVAIADTHIPVRAEKLPQKFLENVSDADLFLHAGDLVDISILKDLESIAPVKAVWGNMDSPETKKYLKQKEIIDVQGIKIGLIHGWGNPDNLVELLKNEFKSDDVDIIVFGHSHKPLNKKNGSVLFFNPGSLTDTFFSDYATYGVIEVNKNNFKTRIEKLIN
jgi:putative phosphoesterase